MYRRSRTIRLVLFLLVGMVLGSRSVAWTAGAQSLESEGALPAPLGLESVSVVRLSADDAFLYAGGGDAIAVYSWAPGTPALLPLQVHRDDVGGVSGLAGVGDIVLSPSGSHLYVSGPDDDAVAVFARDPVTGLLTFVEVQLEGVGGVVDVEGPWDLALSADGAHLYVFAYDSQATAVFATNPTTGTLTFVESEPLPTGVARADVAVSPDGKHVYVSGYSADRVWIYARNPSTGELTYTSEVTSGSPENVTISSDGAHLYLARGGTSTEHYTRNAGTGALTLAGSVPTSHEPEMILSADEDVAFSISTLGHVRTYTRDVASGELTFVALSSIGDFGYGRAAVTADEAWLFRGSDGVEVAAVAPGLTLSPAGAHRVPSATLPVEGAAVSPDGEHLYAAMSTTLIVYDRDPADGSATVQEVHHQGFDGVDDGLARAREVVVSPDGMFVYVTSASILGANPDLGGIAVFARDLSAGSLTFVEYEDAGPGGFTSYTPHVLILGDDLYAVGHQGPTISRFDRDVTTGELTFVEEIATLNRPPSWIVASPDEAFVYVPGNSSGTAFKDLVTAVDTYARDPATGELTVVSTTEVPNHTWGGVLSPGGTELYVASRLDRVDNLKGQHELGTYARDAATGALTKIDEDQSGKGGVYFDEPTRLVMGFDGTHVYGTLEGDYPNTVAALASFVRDPFTGEVSFVEAVPGQYDFAAASPTDPHVYTQTSSVVTPPSLELFSLGFQCSDTPLAGCRSPAKATLQIIDDAVKDKSDRIKFTWRGNTPTTHAELDPVGKHYAICVYDQSGTPDRLLAGGLVLADQTCGNAGKPCWTDKTKKIKFKDSNKTPEGVTQLTLQPHDTKPQIKAKLQGVDLGWRVTSALPPSVPVTVQLQGEVGPCWEASFSAAIKNDGRQFKSVAIP